MAEASADEVRRALAGNSSDDLEGFSAHDKTKVTKTLKDFVEVVEAATKAIAKHNSVTKSISRNFDKFDEESKRRISLGYGGRDERGRFVPKAEADKFRKGIDESLAKQLSDVLPSSLNSLKDAINAFKVGSKVIETKSGLPQVPGAPTGLGLVGKAVGVQAAIEIGQAIANYIGDIVKPLGSVHMARLAGTDRDVKSGLFSQYLDARTYGVSERARFLGADAASVMGRAAAAGIGTEGGRAMMYFDKYGLEAADTIQKLQRRFNILSENGLVNAGSQLIGFSKTLGVGATEIQRVFESLVNSGYGANLSLEKMSTMAANVAKLESTGQIKSSQISTLMGRGGIEQEMTMAVLAHRMGLIKGRDFFEATSNFLKMDDTDRMPIKVGVLSGLTGTRGAGGYMGDMYNRFFESILGAGTGTEKYSAVDTYRLSTQKIKSDQLDMRKQIDEVMGTTGFVNLMRTSTTGLASSLDTATDSIIKIARKLSEAESKLPEKPRTRNYGKIG